MNLCLFVSIRVYLCMCVNKCISVCECAGYETRLECHLLLRYPGVVMMEQVLAARLWCECECIRIDEYMNINVTVHMVYTYVYMYKLTYV